MYVKLLTALSVVMCIATTTQPYEAMVLVPQKKEEIKNEVKEVTKKRKKKFRRFEDYFERQLGKTGCYRACVSMLKKFNPNLRLATSKTSHYIAQEQGDSLVVINNDYSLIDKMLERNLPVVVGVHHTFRYGYNEGTTDHFVVIVRKGCDSEGTYYQYLDPGTKTGCDKQNKFRFVGRLLQSSSRVYILTQIRPFLNLKSNV